MTIEIREQMKGLLRNEQGQGLVEYLLLLVLVVIVIAGLSLKLSKPLKNWADFYLGDYTYCLLDSGELPTLAGGSPVECDKMAEQKGFGKNGAGASANAQNKNSANNSNNNSKNGTNGRGSRSSSGYTGNDKRTVALAGHNNVGADTASEDENKKDLGMPEYYGRGGNRSQSANDEESKRTTVSRSKLRAYDEDQLEKKEQRVPKKVETDGGGQQLKPKRLPVKPPAERAVASVEDKGMGFDFGWLLRIFVIIMIIVATLYILGTQINSITKSSEK